MRWYVGGERYYCLTEYGVDYVWEGADGGNKDAFNKYSNQLNSSFGMLYEFWENAYKGINTGQYGFDVSAESGRYDRCRENGA